MDKIMDMSIKEKIRLKRFGIQMGGKLEKMTKLYHQQMLALEWRDFILAIVDKKNEKNYQSIYGHFFVPEFGFCQKNNYSRTPRSSRKYADKLGSKDDRF